MAIIQIPDPCKEDFSKMSRADNGFHCESCKKQVVDFTSKSDEEITTFIRENQGKKTCGRFKISQVVKHRTFSFQVIRFAAAVLLAFGSFLFTGCSGDEPQIMGEMCVSDSQMYVDSMRYDREYQLMMADSAKKVLDSVRNADSVAKADTTR